MLNRGEQVVQSWDGNCERKRKAIVSKQKLFRTTHETVTAKETNSGTLVLTSQRLIWFERYGFMSKNTKASFSIDLQDLQGIQEGGAINKWISITDSSSENTFHLRGTGGLAVFRDSIMRQRERLQKLETTEELRPEKEVVTMREVVLIKCAHCGSKYQQGTPKCLTCGADL